MNGPAFVVGLGLSGFPDVVVHLLCIDYANVNEKALRGDANTARWL